MHVTVAKVHENLFDGDALSLHAKTTDGEVTILPHHEPLVANLAMSTITVHTGSGEKTFEIESGVLEVSNNQVTVLL